MQSAVCKAAPADTLACVKRPTVGVVLSGGGAKGISHIGVLKVLEENHIPIDYICGTSMGAIVAGLYSIGMTPDEMLELIKSPAFESWYKGKPELKYASYYYKPQPSPSLFSLYFSKENEKGLENKKSKLKISLPTSLVSPYSMDLAVVQLFASPAKACRFNFDSLMVPFFCVSTDIQHKKPYVTRSGDLGSSIRASMTFPFYFKPITMDSLLLYDGGIYNNFPWENMREYFHPDYIIGVQCVRGNITMEEEDIITLANGLVMNDSDYSIPDSLGIIIKKVYPYAIMDFGKAQEIYQAGYDCAEEYIEKIKSRVKRERTQQEIDSMRVAFKSKCKGVNFKKDVVIEGEVDDNEKSFVDRTIREDKRKTISFDQFKKAYAKIVASGAVNTFYPSYVLKKKDSSKTEMVPSADSKYAFTDDRNNYESGDSLFTLKLKVTKKAPFTVQIGGNISSSSLNQGYLGFSYSHLHSNPWTAGATMNLGKYYKGGSLSWRHDVGVKPLAFYYLQFVAHQFDYYNGNQNVFTSDKFPKNVQFKEFFLRGGIATPLSLSNNYIAFGGFSVGREYASSYLKENVASTDVADRGNIFIVSPMVSIKKNTLNYPLYPTNGTDEIARVRYIFANESYTPGSTNSSAAKSKGMYHNVWSARIKEERYFNISKYFSAGFSADLVYSGRSDISNYYTAMLFMPPYEPVPHSTTLMMEDYRARAYAGFSVSPVIKFTPSFYLHSTAAYFMPYELLVRKESGWEYTYSDKFPKGGFIANFALVWQSPVGPVSLSATYYDKGDYKWYPQLNIGFLIFNKRSLED